MEKVVKTAKGLEQLPCVGRTGRLGTMRSGGWSRAITLRLTSLSVVELGGSS